MERHLRRVTAKVSRLAPCNTAHAESNKPTLFTVISKADLMFRAPQRVTVTDRVLKTFQRGEGKGSVKVVLYKNTVFDRK